MLRSLRVLKLAWVLAAFSVNSVAAQSGGTIGLFADLSGWCHLDENLRCTVQLSPFVPGSLYVLAKPNVANTSGGVAGAEYSIKFDFTAGVDALVSQTPNPAATILMGDPLAGGVDIAFPPCQEVDPQGYVLLHTLQVTVLDAARTNDRSLWIERHDTPSNLNFQCALVDACNDEIYTAHCVLGGTIWIDVTTSVEAAPWTAVKALFR